jgi:hypothetical protein
MTPTASHPTLGSALNDTLQAIRRVRCNFTLSPSMVEYGVVTYVGPGVARVRGLPNVKSEELVLLEGDRLGMTFNLDPDDVGVILLDDTAGIESDSEVRRTNRVLDAPVGVTADGAGSRIRENERRPEKTGLLRRKAARTSCSGVAATTFWGSHPARVGASEAQVVAVREVGRVEMVSGYPRSIDATAGLAALPPITEQAERLRQDSFRKKRGEKVPHELFCRIDVLKKGA